MKLLIVGSRCIKEFDLSGYVPEDTDLIISGGANGADKLGERYARERGLKVEVHAALWEQFGKSAGVIRNQEMADISDAVIAFWDGESRGTKNMIENAKKANKPYVIINI